MTISYDPFREMDRLTRALLGAATQEQRGPRSMPMDLYREGDHFVLNIDLPGMDPGSIDVDVEGNTLTVRARRTIRGEETQWLAQERPSGDFLRQLTLGEGLDVENIHAHYDAGVLSLTIPVAKKERARRVQITTGREDRREIGRPEQQAQGEVTGETRE